MTNYIHKVRASLHALYSFCAFLSCVFLMLIAIVILYDLLSPILSYKSQSTDELAGYCMAASAFLGLAYCFHNNDHIRVQLFMKIAPPFVQKALNLLTLIIAVSVCFYLTVFSLRFAWQSWYYHDLSQGLIPFPLWVPHSSMALGIIAFLLSVLEKLLFDPFGKQSHEHPKENHV